MTKEASRFLGEQVGRVVELDESGNGNREGSFLRLRVEVDIRKPLKRVLKVDLSGRGDVRFLMVKYERLPDYCYSCGMLDHGTRECTVTTETSDGTHQQYGPWLRATNPQRNQSSRGRKEGAKGTLKGRLNEGRRGDFPKRVEQKVYGLMTVIRVLRELVLWEAEA